MRDRADKLPVLHHGAAAHALHDAAGNRAQLRIRHGQHHALAARLVVDAVYLRVILLRLVAVHSADYRRGAGVHIAGFDYNVASPRENAAVNAKLGVLLDVAKRLGRVGAAVQLAGRTAAAGHDADYLRVRYAALAQRHKKLSPAVAYAVPKRAVHAAFGVDKGQRTDAGYAVTEPHPKHPLPLARLHRLHGVAACAALALNDHRHWLPVQLTHRVHKILRAVKLTFADADYQVACAYARVARRTALAVRGLNVCKPRHKNAARAYLYPDRLPAEHQLLRERGRAEQRCECGAERQNQKNFLQAHLIPPPVFCCKDKYVPKRAE